MAVGFDFDASEHVGMGATGADFAEFGAEPFHGFFTSYAIFFTVKHIFLPIIILLVYQNGDKITIVMYNCSYEYIFRCCYWSYCADDSGDGA